MAEDFNEPSTVSGIEWKNYKDALILVRPKEFIPEMDTQFGATSAVRADVVVLDGPQADEAYTDTLIFPKVLQSQVRPSIDSSGMVLGRLGQGRAKKGQSAPWTLAPATEDDKKIGRAHLAKNAAAPF